MNCPPQANIGLEWATRSFENPEGWATRRFLRAFLLGLYGSAILKIVTGSFEDGPLMLNSFRFTVLLYFSAILWGVLVHVVDRFENKKTNRYLHICLFALVVASAVFLAIPESLRCLWGDVLDRAMAEFSKEYKGSTLLAIGFTICVNLAPITIKLYQLRDGRRVLAAMKEDGTNAIAITSFGFWMLVFMFVLFYKVPNEILLQANQATPLRIYPISPPLDWAQKTLANDNQELQLQVQSLEQDLGNVPIDYRNIDKTSPKRLARELRTAGRMYREFERQYNDFMEKQKVDNLHMPQSFGQYAANSAVEARILIQEARSRLHDSSQINGDVGNALNGAIVPGKQHSYSAVANLMDSLADRLEKTNNH